MNDIVGELGQLIDHAVDRGDKQALADLAERSERAATEASDGSMRITLRYFRANALGGLHALRLEDRTYMWGWEQPEAAGQIYALRQAVADPAFHEVDIVRRSQIRTNLGNCLSGIGRPVEAIETWSSVLADAPNFAMALGNRGRGLGFYAGRLYDEGHQAILLLTAFDDFQGALSTRAFWDSGRDPSVAAMFAAHAEQVGGHIDIDATRNLITSSMTPEWDDVERRFRTWALEKRLFLNPLNDVGVWPFVAEDVLHLPSHAYSIHDETPRFVAYYDQLKSEYVAARALFYEATQSVAPTLFDRDVLLFDSLDGVRYGLSVEKLKLAFRLGYSLFDKVAAFVADYFKLQRAPDDVSFRNVFYQKGKPPQPLVGQFAGVENWPLRGLYALSRDLYERSQQDVAEPDAQELYEDRNAAEHRFFSLHDSLDLRSGPIHRRGYFPDFELKTLRLLKRARAALIYLSLAVAREEELRDQAKPGAFRMAMATTPYRRPDEEI